MVNLNHTDWWFQPTPLKNDGLKVSWKYDIPNMMGKIIQSCSSHHQPAEHTLWSMEITWMENVGKKICQTTYEYQFSILQYRYLNDRQAEA